jgi:succinate dehydrogenase hydrophobic anchor subunit
MATTKPRTLSLSTRGLNVETFLWFSARLTALAIYGLILAGIIGALVVSARAHANFADVLRWAFFPNASPNPFNGMPWVALLAKLMVIAFILVTSAHGVHGAIEILDDYITHPLWRHTLRHAGGAIFFVVVNAIAIFIIWTA